MVPGHDNPTIWSMVAFIEKLPGMTPAQYKAIVAKAPPDEDMHMGEDGGHSHGEAADEDAHSAADMKGMDMSGEAGHSHGAAAEDDHDHAATAAPAAEAPLSLEGMKPKARSEEHTSELQSLMRLSYAALCLKKKQTTHSIPTSHTTAITKHNHQHK